MSKKSKIILAAIVLQSTTIFAQRVVADIILQDHNNALYLKCGNERKIINPDVSAIKNLKYVCKGGDVIISSEKPDIIIVPDSSRVILEIYNGTKLIASKEFRVRLVPKPYIDVYADSCLIQSLNRKDRVFKNFTWFTVKAIPDVFFENICGYDSRYSITSWQIFLLRNEKALDSLSFNTETGDIRKLLATAQSGDELYVEVYQVMRRNFMGRKEEVELGTVIRNIRIE